jgi:uncharacterized protein (TIGR02001 family)
VRAVLALVALLCAPAMAAAQLTGNVALLSDYRFRGESLTEGRPALQASLNYDHSSGLFAGGLVSNVRIDPDVIGLGAQIYGGYAHPIGERAAWDVGVVTYVFPQPSTGPTYNYTEAFIGASFDTLNSRLYYTNSYFGGAPGTYLELNGSRALSDHISVIGHLGYLWLSEPREPGTSMQRHGTVDFLAGVTAEVKGFTFGLSIVGTNAPQDACPATTGQCSTTVVLSVSHNF